MHTHLYIHSPLADINPDQLERRGGIGPPVLPMLGRASLGAVPCPPCPEQPAMRGHTRVCTEGRAPSLTARPGGRQPQRSRVCRAGGGTLPGPGGHWSPSTKGPPADGGQVLPAHLRKGVSPPAAAVAFSTPLVFARVLSPAGTPWIFSQPYRQPAATTSKRRSCPVLTLLPHQHEASLCPETPPSLTLLNHGCQIPASAWGGERPLPQGFSDLPAWPLQAPPVPRQITARPRLPFPGTPWAGTWARKAAAATASACKVPRGQHTSQPGCLDQRGRQQCIRQSPPSPPIPQGQGTLGSVTPSQGGQALTKS